MTREKVILKTSYLGILINLSLTISKAIVGAISGSVSILLDAVNNLTDLLSAIVTIVGTKLAGRAPDREHPYGHGRIEYVAAVGVGFAIFLAGATALYEAVPRILNPEPANYSAVTLAVVSVAVVTKFFFGRYVRKKGKENNSRSLEATGTDALMDALLSFGTLVSAVVAILFNVSVDGVVGAIIALFIIRSSFEILMESGRDIIGRRVDPKISRGVRRMINEFIDVKEISELALHSYGPETILGAAKIRVSKRLSAQEISKLTEEIEEKVLEKYQVKLTIGIRV